MGVQEDFLKDIIARHNDQYDTTRIYSLNITNSVAIFVNNLYNPKGLEYPPIGIDDTNSDVIIRETSTPLKAKEDGIITTRIGADVIDMVRYYEPGDEIDPKTGHRVSLEEEPVIEIEEESETEDIPFKKVTKEDGTTDVTKITQQGVNGIKTLTYSVTYTDGVETDRELISEEVTKEPVDEITTIGTKPEPVIETVTETETEVVPFEELEEEDDTKDYTEITQVGVNGVKTFTYSVTYTDGVETNKELVSEEITTEPVPQITTIGTKPDPVIETETETETEVVPFEKIEEEDDTTDVTEVTQQGVDGVRTYTYSVTYTDGVETNKELVSNEITTEPIPEITTVGTKQPDPEPEPEPDPEESEE